MKDFSISKVTHDLLRAVVEAALLPHQAWLALRGLKTFSLRMERQCANGMEVAGFLEEHPLIEKVQYAGLPSHPQHETANGRPVGQDEVEDLHTRCRMLLISQAAARILSRR